MNPDEVRGMFAPRKNLARSSSSSSISSDSSNTSVATNGSHSNGTSLSSTSEGSQWSANGPQRKRPQPKNPWPTGKGDMPSEFSRVANGRPNGMLPHGVLQQSPVGGGGQSQLTQQGMMRPPGQDQSQGGQPVLYLLSMNGTFERKTIVVPFAPENLRIGRQTNQKTLPTPTNGFFDSKVLSRQHAEIFAERNGKIFIRDVKSSNGTFVNGIRLSQENRESEPHELQTADQLELGIDIVSEDQKTVVHHKVAAKVEHAGFLTASNNVMDMSFGDLDPANGSMMMATGQMQMRGRQANNNAGMGPNGRMMQNGPIQNPQPNGMMQQRPFFVPPIATDQIMKRLATEMRNAKLQAQDLGRTNQFITTLLSKEDIKDLEKAESQEAPKPSPMVNGNGIPLRTDAKTRFSDPPAPPPQQPLPEKPDVPGLKRAAGERSKSGPTVSSPGRQDNVSQIIQLTEALNNAKRDMDTQTARMRELEAMLEREREARVLAEDLAMRLEESAKTQLNGSAVTPAKEVEETLLETTVLSNSADDIVDQPHDESGDQADGTYEVDSTLQIRLSTMETQVDELRGQMEQWKTRCEAAETERDSGRKSLAEMVIKLREEEARRVAAEEKALSTSPHSTEEGSRAASTEGKAPIASSALTKAIKNESTKADEPEQLEESPTLSRANTITPLNAPRRGMPTFQSKKFRSAGEANAFGARYRAILSKRPFLMFGLPFLAVIVAGSFVLTPATAIRYERHDRRVRQMTRDEELNVRRSARKVDMREEYYVREGD
ncbi:cytoplasm to vacuole targeting Vps64 [Cordyceps fumosorosea ARSEF 2679]|uniref:Cytochrome c oxidase assembly protein COX16, mitochondrial n=1 Tax=Cordyceps fumosorosea (strain ARSEF 2679) TaxID=1081104 RepID=A0A167MZ95_CORFA|nr:cytoplasm to vacuole targeting Vps64 [Cordyceps fumosorosea ARSEF 2679]OAA54937.1 cytoplasm to vacuole targeting Vps64 [Cordyceps fumosorosea ARSEF 2679]